jgi:hypothetical protein
VLGAVGGVAIGAVLVVLVDAVFAYAHLGRFGDASGMFAALPAVFVLYDEYVAAASLPGRLPLAALSGVLALIVGSGAGFAVSGLLPPLGSGAVAALVFAVVYAFVWYAGSSHLRRRISP